MFEIEIFLNIINVLTVTAVELNASLRNKVLISLWREIKGLHFSYFSACFCCGAWLRSHGMALRSYTHVWWDLSSSSMKQHLTTLSAIWVARPRVQQRVWQRKVNNNSQSSEIHIQSVIKLLLVSYVIRSLLHWCKLINIGIVSNLYGPILGLFSSAFFQQAWHCWTVIRISDLKVGIWRIILPGALCLHFFFFIYLVT